MGLNLLAFVCPPLNVAMRPTGIFGRGSHEADKLNTSSGTESTAAAICDLVLWQAGEQQALLRIN